MDLTIRDWMIVIGAGLILLVLADAVRRVYQDRRSEVRMNAKISRRDEADDDDDDAFNLLHELPNGGARIVQRDDLQSDGAPQHEEQQGSEDPVIDQGHVSPVLESARVQEEEELPSFSATEEAPVPAVEAAPGAQGQGPGEVAAPTPAGRDDTPETMDWLDSLEAPEPEPEPEVRLPRGIDPHVFVLNVVARSEHGFSGSDILAVLLACDLRFGDMDFFHRHEQSAGRGPIQFTVCNMMKPGVFDIDAMDHLRTRGLMFFVTLPGPDDMLKAFDYMYETAKVVARNLDGDVLDETRSAITRQSLEHMRQQIRELERRIAMQQRL